MSIERLLGVMSPDQQAGWQRNLRWFRAFVFTYVAARSLLTLQPEFATPDSVMYQGVQVMLIVAGMAGLQPRLSMWMARLAALLVLVHIVFTLPFTANHLFLEFIVLGLLALLDERQRDEGELLLQALRWVTAIVFVYAGLQKILYGRYFDGQFLGYLTATEYRFAWFFRHLLPADEFARLMPPEEFARLGRELHEGRPGMRTPAEGAGPFSVALAKAPLFVIASNLSYMLELGAGVLMMVRRTRIAGALIGLAVLLMIELGAREIIFGALMANLLLLMLPGAWNRRLFWLFAAMWLVLLGMWGLGVKAMYHV